MRFKFDWASLIYSFALFYFVKLRAISKYEPRRGEGGYIWRGDLTEGFCVTSLGVYIWRGLFSEFYTVLPNMTKKVSRWLIQLK